MVADRLDELIETSPGCRNVAFADLSIGMALVVAGPETLSREVLDRLCAEADLTLGNDEAGLGARPSSLSVSATPTDTKVFVRSEIEPNDALLCLCKPEIDLTNFIGRAQACLAAVSGGDQ